MIMRRPRQYAVNNDTAIAFEGASCAATTREKIHKSRYVSKETI
jgi:hypothetical protein